MSACAAAAAAAAAVPQPWDDPYVPRTYPHLLKWKFRHMNSVDFKLAALPGQQPRLLLNCATRRKHGSADINHLSLQGEEDAFHCAFGVGINFTMKGLLFCCCLFCMFTTNTPLRSFMRWARCLHVHHGTSTRFFLLLLLLLADMGLGEQRVEFPGEVDPTLLHGKVRSSAICSTNHSLKHAIDRVVLQ
jgi:hypothetical protein